MPTAALLLNVSIGDKLQLKIARNLKEAAEMAKMDSSSDSDEDD